MFVYQRVNLLQHHKPNMFVNSTNLAITVLGHQKVVDFWIGWVGSLTVAKQQAWSVQALCQGLMANIGWLHSPSQCSKSRLHSFVTNDLEVDGVPSHAKAEKSFCNTGTLRGHRNNLYNYGRTGLATSEITETYKTKMESDGLPSAQFAQKSHINKRCHSESDRSATGRGLHWKSTQVAMPIGSQQAGPRESSWSVSKSFFPRFNCPGQGIINLGITS